MRAPQVDAGAEIGEAYMAPPSINVTGQATHVPTGSGEAYGGGAGDAAAVDTMRVLHLISAFQTRGHEYASLDPLDLRAEGLTARDRMGNLHNDIADLDYRTYGFSEDDLHRPLDLVDFRSTEAVQGLMANADINQDGQTTLAELLEALSSIYTSHVGTEYLHLRDLDRINWIRSRIERFPRPEQSKEERLNTLERLTFAERFETFLAQKYVRSLVLGGWC